MGMRYGRVPTRIACIWLAAGEKRILSQKGKVIVVAAGPHGLQDAALSWAQCWGPRIQSWELSFVQFVVA